MEDDYKAWQTFLLTKDDADACRVTTTLSPDSEQIINIVITFWIGEITTTKC